MKQCKLLVLAAALAVYPGISFSAPSQSVGLTLGGGVPLTDVSVSNVGGGKATMGSTGVVFGGRYLRGILPDRPQLSVGTEFNYFSSGNNKSTSFIPNASSVLSASSFAMLAIAKYSFETPTKLLPYVLGGFGFGQSSWKIEATPSSGSAWANTGTTEKRTLLDNGGWNYALALGAGADVPINETWSAGGELRWQQIGSRTYPTTSNGQALGVSGFKGAFNNFHLTGHASYRF